MGHRLRRAGVLLLVGALVGCSSSQPLIQGERLHNNSENIRVELIDHQIITFRAGEYTVNPQVDSLYLAGSGRVRMTKERAEHSFEGIIRYDEITSLDIVRKNSVGPVIYPIGAAALLVSLYFILDTDSPPIEGYGVVDTR